MKDGRKKKRKTRKAEDEKNDPGIECLVGTYGLLVMETYVMERDAHFSFLVIKAFTLGYNSGKANESSKEKFEDVEFVLTMLSILLKDFKKEDGVYELYLLIWALKKGREIWFKVQDNWEKMKALFNDSHIEADKKEILPPTEHEFKIAEINYEDLSPEMKKAIDDIQKGNKDKLS